MIIQYDWCLYHGETVGHTETDTEYHMKLKAKIGVMDEDEGKDAVMMMKMKTEIGVMMKKMTAMMLLQAKVPKDFENTRRQGKS